MASPATQYRVASIFPVHDWLTEAIRGLREPSELHHGVGEVIEHSKHVSGTKALLFRLHKLLVVYTAR